MFAFSWCVCVLTDQFVLLPLVHKFLFFARVCEKCTCQLKPVMQLAMLPNT